jgi:hypothetical protein
MRRVILHMQKPKNSWIRIPLLLLLLVLWINPASASNPQNEDMDVEYYSIPSPEEILSYIHKNEINYTPSLLTDVKKKNNFVTSRDKLLAYGFYMANLAYTISFEQTGMSLRYFEVTEEMGRQLNIFPPEVEKYGERLMKNIGRKDSLEALYDDLYLLVIANLHDNERFGDYALISAGGFVESLYLALNSDGSRIKEDDFRMRVWDQKMIMDQILKMFERYLSPQLKTSVLSDMNGLISAFNEYVDTSTPAVSGNRRNDGVVVLGSPAKNETAVKSIEKIHAEVNLLRKRWVKD